MQGGRRGINKTAEEVAGLGDIVLAECMPGFEFSLEVVAGDSGGEDTLPARSGGGLGL